MIDKVSEERVFIAGLQRSGTNFAESIFEGSTPVCGDYGKHDIRRDDWHLPCEKIYLIIKHPYTWVESICFRNCVDIIEYHKDYELYNVTDYYGPKNINIRNLMRLYRDYYCSWLVDGRTRLVHYEDLLRENLDRVHSKVPFSADWIPYRAQQYLNSDAPLVNGDCRLTIKECLGHEFLKSVNYLT